MPYQTGSSTDPVDLLGKIATWLSGLGWTIDRNAPEGAGLTVTAHHNGNYVNLRACPNELSPWQRGYNAYHYGIHMYLGTGYNSSQPWNAQPGAPLGSASNPIGVGMNLSAGPYANYYFFADATADNVVIVLEKTPGLFVYLGWGLSLQKAGNYTGGAYFFGSSSGFYSSYTYAGANTPGFTSTSDGVFPSTDQIGGGCGFVRADVDSFTGQWIGIWRQTYNQDLGYTGKMGQTATPTTNASPFNGNQYAPAYRLGPYPAGSEFFDCLVSTFDGRANLVPPILYALRDGTTTGYSILGSPPFLFLSNAVGAGFNAAAEYVVGSTTYKLFPNFAVVKQ